MPTYLSHDGLRGYVCHVGQPGPTVPGLIEGASGCGELQGLVRQQS